MHTITNEITVLTDREVIAFEDNFDATLYQEVAEMLGHSVAADIADSTIAEIDLTPVEERTQAQRVQAHMVGLGEASGLTVLHLYSRRRADIDAQQRHDAYLRDELAELGWDGDRPVEDYFAYGKRVPFTEETVDTAEWIEVAA